ncbi:tRNA(Phe) (4-demethylwyosine(37)-C(7)) aminocarboxypropyltransferase Taw2 [Methanococcus aeolicus]|uniref:tRNA(Phe) (4-demethylwyosine(37)-C(7)) aminocarboxypropyltransferase Taw2 n=1 Tax=Methanococcus aeolicus TaxID=42879 RepID=UPI0021C7A5CE|nr:class I SAM-dependent methyltransferase family protein [Methanococcus aeolicus]UXM84231.1 class I SAM-dependent methyltransferase family protein [Methanococcus aeolicus]
MAKKYQKIGDILLVKTDISNEEINQLVNKTKCKTILKYDNIKGELRQPKTTIIYGNETETIQKEYNILFKIDVSKIMWSMGNIDERKRMADISNPNEVVIDMFAGIGYFTIPMAKYSKPKKIYALELNPDSYHYLVENIKLNKLNNDNNNNNKIIPILGDNRKANLRNTADRIIMGYVLKTGEFLDKAFEYLKEDGGIIHYHDTIAEKILDKEPYSKIKNIAEKNNYKIIDYKLNKIKKYSPGVWHVVADVKFETTL